MAERRHLLCNESLVQAFEGIVNIRRFLKSWSLRAEHLAFMHQWNYSVTANSTLTHPIATLC